MEQISISLTKASHVPFVFEFVHRLCGQRIRIKTFNPVQTASHKWNNGSQEEYTIIVSSQHFIFKDTFISLY